MVIGCGFFLFSSYYSILVGILLYWSYCIYAYYKKLFGIITKVSYLSFAIKDTEPILVSCVVVVCATESGKVTDTLLLGLKLTTFDIATYWYPCAVFCHSLQDIVALLGIWLLPVI